MAREAVGEESVALGVWYGVKFRIDAPQYIERKHQQPELCGFLFYSFSPLWEDYEPSRI